MKCEHCGKNEATFYYKSNINGAVTEQHLCADCAKALGYADTMEKSFAEFGNFRKSMLCGLDDFFAPMPALAGNVFESFDRTFSGWDRMFPQLSEVAAPADARTEERKSAAAGNDLVSEEEHRKLDQERQINALRCEMQEAIKTENLNVQQFCVIRSMDWKTECKEILKNNR